MCDTNHVVNLDKYEQGLAITALNDKRTELLREQQCTDMVDELLLKIIHAPSKRTKKAKSRNEAR